MITSTSNDKVKRLTQLQASSRARREAGLFVTEGIRIIREIPGDQIQEIYCSESFYKKNKDIVEALPVKPVLLSDAVFKKVADTKTPQGILAVACQSHYELEDILNKKKLTLLVMENLQNPGNLGTLLRTGEAADITGVILSRDSVDIYNPKVIRGSMGAFLRVPFVYTDDLPDTLQKLKEKGVKTFATHLDAKKNCYEIKYPEKMALLIGNEGNGLSDVITEFADHKILIPMAGKVESLNAAVAASVLIYEIYRQKLGF